VTSSLTCESIRQYKFEGLEFMSRLTIAVALLALAGVALSQSVRRSPHSIYACARLFRLVDVIIC
jgi:hypothetical protein